MNNFLKTVLKRAETEVQTVEAGVKAEVQKIGADIKAFEQKFVKKVVAEEKAVWAMARADLVKFATTSGVVNAVQKTSNAIIVELKKLGLVK